MIINKTITLKTFGNRRLVYFDKLGYDISGEDFEIKIEDLNIGSREIVEVSCDYCYTLVNITYKEYLRNISGYINKYACCVKCGSSKAEEKSLLKNGVSHPMKLKETQEKTKKTNFEKYGVEFLMQSVEIREKSKETCLEKYGVDHISKSNHFKEKFKETCLENHGVEYPMMSVEIQEKSKNTLIENYGVDNPSKSKDIRNKVKSTNLDKFGNENYLLTDEFRRKSTITSVNRYGVDNYNTRIKSNLNPCTICYPINDQRSIKENELLEFIKLNYCGEIISNYRDKLQIDIYLPELNLGFEFNGLYFHSEKFKDNNYHLNKTNYFKNLDIRIIHIWEDDWSFKQDISKSMIINLLGKNTKKIFAIKCVIKELKTVTDFLNNNHIQGVDKSIKKIGLLHNDELVSVMTFNKLEGRKKLPESEWNLSRFCNIINVNIIGGASKLLNYFIREYKPTRIISYADKDWSIGQLYHTIGFTNILESKPDYKYIINNKRSNKQNFKKKDLGIQDKMTESKFMINNVIYKIYDCGKMKFEKLI